MVGDVNEEDLPCIEIMEDNRGCKAMIENPVHHPRTKHILVKYHNIRECVEDGMIRVLDCKTRYMTADIFTKPLGGTLFREHRDGLGIVEVPVNPSTA